VRKRLCTALLFLLVPLCLPATGQALTVGIGDQQPGMFASPFFQALHVKIARYIAPYDLADEPAYVTQFTQWLAGAQLLGIEPHVAFYYSYKHPTKIPSPRQYVKEVKKFRKLFPAVKSFETWNESNRGNVDSGATRFHSPTAKQAAGLYDALRGACKGCKIVGLDVLDTTHIAKTVKYIKDFKKAVHHMPTIWGLHNYSDTNRFHSSGTKAVAKVVPGQIWLTETGGIVKFGGAFPGGKKGLARAKKALDYMFKLARSNRKIKRLYIFQWTGATNVRFDAGLTNPDGTVRPGYAVVKRHIKG
jgi:hypothetical protein